MGGLYYCIQRDGRTVLLHTEGWSHRKLYYYIKRDGVMRSCITIYRGMGLQKAVLLYRGMRSQEEILLNIDMGSQGAVL